jgi:hypothetical protein
MTGDAPRTGGTAVDLLREALPQVFHPPTRKRIEAYLNALSSPAPDSTAYRIEVGNDGLLVVGPDDEQWDMSEEDGIASLVDRLNAPDTQGEHVLDVLGRVVDTAENYAEYGTKATTPAFSRLDPGLRIDALSNGLVQVRDAVKALYFRVGRRGRVVMSNEERHDYRPSSDLDGSPCAFCRMRPDEHDDFAPEVQ